MLVYMLLNTVTEKAYVGATDKTLEQRWQRHLKDARHGSTWRLHQAIREWPEEFWSVVVLSNCYSVEELSSAETAWIRLTHVDEHEIGYNDNRSSYASAVTNGRKGGDPTTDVIPAKTSPLFGLTSEQRREYFRECGKRGASHGAKGARPRTQMTEAERERFREWGRLGAQRSRLKGSQ